MCAGQGERGGAAGAAWAGGGEAGLARLESMPMGCRVRGCRALGSRMRGPGNWGLSSLRSRREVCSVHFLSAASLLSVFLAGEARIPQGPALDTHFPLSVSPLGLQSPQPPPAPHHSALTDPHARKPLPLSPALSWSLLHLLPPLENVSRGHCSLGG